MVTFYHLFLIKYEGHSDVNDVLLVHAKRAHALQLVLQKTKKTQKIKGEFQNKRTLMSVFSGRIQFLA